MSIAERPPDSSKNLRQWVVGIVAGRKEKEKGDSIEERFKKLGMAIVKEDLSKEYEGIIVFPTGVALAGKEVEGDEPPFMFWRGKYAAQDVSVFWIKRSFGEFSRDQAHAALGLATQDDILKPPELNDWKTEGGIPHDIITIIQTYYPYYP